MASLWEEFKNINSDKRKKKRTLSEMFLGRNKRPLVTSEIFNQLKMTPGEFDEQQSGYNPPGTMLSRAWDAISSTDREMAGKVIGAVTGKGPDKSTKEVYNPPGTKLSRAIDAIRSADSEQTGIILDNLGLIKEKGALPMAGRTISNTTKALAKGGKSAIDLAMGQGATDRFSTKIANRISKPLAEAAAIADTPVSQAMAARREPVRPQDILTGNEYAGAAANVNSTAGEEYLARRRAEMGRPQSAVRRERAAAALAERQAAASGQPSALTKNGSVRGGNQSIGEEAGFAVAGFMADGGMDPEFDGKAVERSQKQVQSFVERNPQQAEAVTEYWQVAANAGVKPQIIAKYFNQWSRALGDDKKLAAISKKMQSESA